jgi:3-hydroxyisobutyrate dehydrogenase-like beta-hydroxyacid dehydrogenase
MLGHMTDEAVRFAVLGLGEAGGAFAADLAAAGADVVGFDPRVNAASGLVIRRAANAAAACAGADVVLSLNSATVAEEVAASVLPAMRAGAVYADLNTGSPSSKTRMGLSALQCGVRFAEVVLMAPVPGRGAAVASLAAGPGGDEYARAMRRYGGHVDVVEGPIGTATTRKLLRSIVIKGLAAAVMEALEAGRRAGCAEWVRDDLRAQFGAELVDRLENGTRKHAAGGDRDGRGLRAARRTRCPPLIADATR